MSVVQIGYPAAKPTKAAAPPLPPYEAHLGGAPTFYGHVGVPRPCCSACGTPLLLITQVYAPTDRDRTLYIYACNAAACDFKARCVAPRRVPIHVRIVFQLLSSLGTYAIFQPLRESAGVGASCAPKESRMPLQLLPQPLQHQCQHRPLLLHQLLQMTAAGARPAAGTAAGAMRQAQALGAWARWRAPSLRTAAP